MLVSSNKTMVDKRYGFGPSSQEIKARHYQHSEIGYNYRMSNISAGIGRSQLKGIE